MVLRVIVVLAVISVAARYVLLLDLEVRGRSMEPLLHGTGGDPDRIFVARRYYDVWSAVRHDLVVYDRPAVAAESALPDERDGGLFVKRVLGLPGEVIQLVEGDVLVAPSEDEEPSRVVRPLGVLDETETVVHRLDPSAPMPWIWVGGVVAEGDGVSLDADQSEAGARLRYTERIHIDDPDQGEVWVNDTGLRFRVRATREQTSVAVTLVEKQDQFVLTLSDDAPARLTRRFLDGPDEPTPLGAETRLPVGRAVDVRFLNVDNRLLVWFDGELVADEPYRRNSDVIGTWSNAPSLALERGALVVEELVVVRDTHYTSSGEFGVSSPYRIPDGEYFLLGDHSHHSRDSRHFGAVPRERFRGRPWVRYAPAERRRRF